MRTRFLSMTATLLALPFVSLIPAHATIAYSFVSTSAGDPYTGTLVDNFSNIRLPETSYWINGGVVTTCAAITGNTGACNSSIGAPPQIGGVGDPAVPAGVTGNFLQVSPGATPATYGVGFFQIGGLSAFNSISFDWGSVDQWNFAQLLNAQGQALITVSGTDLGATFNNGIPYSPGDERITFTWSSSDPVTTLQFGDTFGPAMEVANVTSATPEPSSLALLGTGLLGLGNLVRRRRA